MRLPEPIEAFRNLSLLHDTALTMEQRRMLLGSLSANEVIVHEMFVQKLLGGTYQLQSICENRAKISLFQSVAQRFRAH